MQAGPQIGMESDFNSGTGAVKKTWKPGNQSQQNSNPFGATERGFKPAPLKKIPTGGTSNAVSNYGRPPMGGGSQQFGSKQP